MANITRVGIGFDIHRLVVLHAVAEAVAGAAGLADIGEQFPDNLKATEGMDSKIIVEKMLRGAEDKGLGVINLDAVVQAEKPRISEHKQQLRESLAGLLKVDIEAINIKGRTAEGLGEIGREEAIACTAIVGLGEVQK